MEYSSEILEENARRVALRAQLMAASPVAAADAPGTVDDFEWWAAHCVKIKDKLSGRLVPFVLNRPQRRVLALLEEQRRAGRPIRLIMLKARQWGGSTLVQTYMAWIQLVHAENWHSLICAHVKDTASTIRGMYSTLLANYPPELSGGEQARFVPFEGMRNVRLIPHRGCHITICSGENPEAARGADYAMAHLSEVAFWPDTPQRTPEALVRAICGSVARTPLSLIVMESTANGPANFFHREWVRAVAGQSDKVAVFVPWHEIDIYSEPLAVTPEELWTRLDDYERAFWEQGLTLEQINWYHNKRLEYTSHYQMMAEYPSTPAEAFSNSRAPVFNPAHVEHQRLLCMAPQRVGELSDAGEFVDSPAGRLEVWLPPVERSECRRLWMPYVVSVDVGGNWDGADWSVVAVFDCRREGFMELAAQWRGHIDHDRLGQVAERIARWYNNALLVIESNTLDSGGSTVLADLGRRYNNLYRRTHSETAGSAPDVRYGFHTNVATKGAAMAALTAALRDRTLIEHSAAAIDEFATYVRLPSGTLAAAPGCHDDMVMTRAIAAFVVHDADLRPLKPWR
jgi:hypothetical protein